MRRSISVGLLGATANVGFVLQSKREIIREAIFVETKSEVP